MYIYFLLLWGIVFLYSIISSLLKLKEISSLLDILYKYLESATYQPPFYQAAGPRLIKKDNYSICLNELLYNFPRIRKYSKCYFDFLQYGASDIDNYSSAINLYNRLLMKKNYLIESFKASLNPLCSLQTLFLLPGKFLHWLGLSRISYSSRVLNLACWIIAYLLNVYSNEIKSLINSVIKNFI